MRWHRRAGMYDHINIYSVLYVSAWQVNGGDGRGVLDCQISTFLVSFYILLGILVNMIIKQPILDRYRSDIRSSGL